MSKHEKIQRDENGKKIFTADSKLGFMRLIQVYNIVSIALTMFFFLLCTHTILNSASSIFVILVVIEMLCQAVVVWLIGKRKMHARVLIPLLYLFIALIEIVANAIIDEITLTSVLNAVFLRAIASVYLLTSRRAKAVLVQPLDIKFLSRDTAIERKMWNPKSIEFWMRILIYFFVFSVLGHWMEIGVQILVVNGLFPGTIAGADSLTHRDAWNPFFIYGIAVSFCGLVLFPIYVKLKEKCPHIWQAFLCSFLINALFVVLAEIVLGTLFNADYSAWDYRNQFLNWNGQVCLLYSIAFALMASLITWVIYPFLEHLFSFVGKDALRIIFVVSAVFFIFLYVTYNVDLTDLYQQFGMNSQVKNTLGNSI